MGHASVHCTERACPSLNRSAQPFHLTTAPACGFTTGSPQPPRHRAARELQRALVHDAAVLDHGRDRLRVLHIQCRVRSQQYRVRELPDLDRAQVAFAPMRFTNESLAGPWITGCASVSMPAKRRGARSFAERSASRSSKM